MLINIFIIFGFSAIRINIGVNFSLKWEEQSSNYLLGCKASLGTTLIFESWVQNVRQFNDGVWAGKHISCDRKIRLNAERVIKLSL